MKGAKCNKIQTNISKIIMVILLQKGKTIMNSSQCLPFFFLLYFESQFMATFGNWIVDRVERTIAY